MENDGQELSFEPDLELEQQLPEAYEEEVAEQKVKTFVVPDSKIKLLACERCRLIKTEVQWKVSMTCDNCRSAQMGTDYKKFTSNKIDGMVSIMDSNRSWLRKKLNLGKNIVSGLYAVQLL